MHSSISTSMKRLISLFIILLSTYPIYATTTTNNEKFGVINGYIKDMKSNASIEYATVSVFKQDDSKLIDGTITNKDGFFEIKKLNAGNYYIEVSFIGYEKKIVSDIAIRSYKRENKLNDIKLNLSTKALREIVVNSDKDAISYQIDKKVVTVSKQLSASGGTAIDVLETVPSVNVDVNGNVNLRGSSDFTVLIDGKRSQRSAQEILSQIPTSQIENIEIITNPSAKYSSDGEAGIINIVSKKFTLKGTSAAFNLSPGSHENFSTSGMLNMKQKKNNFSLGANYTIRTIGGKRTINKTILNTNPEEHLDATGDMDRKPKTLNLSSAYDLELDSMNSISITGQYGRALYENINDLRYDEYKSNGAHIFENSKEEAESENNYFVTTINYLKKFNTKGHQLNIFIDYTQRKYDKTILSDNKRENDPQNQFKSLFNEDAKGIYITTDYTLPLSKNNKFEAGYEFKKQEYNCDRTLEETLGSTNIPHPEFEQTSDNNKTIHSLYTLYSGKVNKFSYQLGFRAENTNRDIKYAGDNFRINRWDFFPSVHSNLKLNKTSSLSANYSRRIKRPSSSNLEPFVIWNDRYNWTMGNPNLKPQYINSFELNYKTKLGKHSLSFETYYRMTEDKMEHIKTLVENNSDIILSGIENIGTDHTIGLESSLISPLTKWWKSILIADVSHYKVEGDYMDRYSFSTSNTNWNLRQISYFTLSKITQIQLNLLYKSKSKWAQGENDDSFKATIAIKHSFFKRRLAANLTINDIFNTADLKKTYVNEDLILVNKVDMDAPIFKLSLSYKINNYKSIRRRRSSGL